MIKLKNDLFTSPLISDKNIHRIRYQLFCPSVEEKFDPELS
jgi:hypothetical protein